MWCAGAYSQDPVAGANGPVPRAASWAASRLRPGTTNKACSPTAAGGGLQLRSCAVAQHQRVTHGLDPVGSPHLAAHNATQTRERVPPHNVWQSGPVTPAPKVAVTANTQAHAWHSRCAPDQRQTTVQAWRLSMRPKYQSTALVLRQRFQRRPSPTPRQRCTHGYKPGAGPHVHMCGIPRPVTCPFSKVPAAQLLRSCTS